MLSLAIAVVALLLWVPAPDAVAQSNDSLVISVDGNTSVTEGSGNLRVTFRLNRPAPADGVMFHWNVLEGSATQDEDYDPFMSSQGAASRFDPGATRSEHYIHVYDDDMSEDDETVQFVILKAWIGGMQELLDGSYTDTLISIGDSEATGTIIDNDEYIRPPAPNTPTPAPTPSGPPEVTLLGSGPFTEGETVYFSLSHDVQSKSVPVSVTISQSGNFLASGQAGRRTVRLNTGRTQTVFQVATVDDGRDENDGSITATLNSGPGYRINSDYQSATVDVTDNDFPVIDIVNPTTSVVTGSSIREGGTARFTLRANPRPVSNLTVNVNVSEQGSFAASGQTGSRTVTIGTNGVGILTVATESDNFDEKDGSITVTVLDGVGYTVGSRVSVSMVVTDGGPSTPRISIAAGSAIDEGGTATFTLRSNPAPAADLTVAVNVTSSGGSFATSSQTGSRTVIIGTNGVGALTVATQDDDAEETNGQITATLVAGPDYVFSSPASASVNVRDVGTTKPKASIISVGAALPEGDSATFQVTVNPAPVADLTVSVNVTQQGSFANDDQIGSRTVVVGTDGTGSLRVETVDDGQDEKDGSITATLTSGNDYALGSVASATLQVEDDDLGVDERAVSVGDASLRENNREGLPFMRFPVTLSGSATSRVLVGYKFREIETGANRATAGQDFHRESGAVQFLPGETLKYASALVLNDDLDEEIETFEIVLTYVIGPAEIDDGEAIGTILPDPHDAARGVPVITVSADRAVNEGQSFRVTLRAEPAPKDDIQVTLNFTDAEGSDFITAANEGTRVVTFYGDVSLVEWTWNSYTIGTVNDSADEANGAVLVEVVAPDDGSYTVGETSSAGVIIYDDDGAPTQLPTLSVSDATATESSGSMTFRVTISPPAPQHGTVSVYYMTEQGTAQVRTDYVHQSGEIVFQGGQSEKTVVIDLLDDDLRESDETFSLSIIYPDGATIADGRGVGTIQASDPP